MDGAEARKERIAQIARFIQSQLYANKDTGWIPYKKTVTKIEIETGLTRQKIIGIIELLCEAGDRFDLNREEDRINRYEV